MSFGIQGKVALLVIVATVSSALIVAKVLNDRAVDVLREHEIVDLGDEASLRAWTLINQVDSLHDDVISLTQTAEFQKAVYGVESGVDLEALAQKYCRTTWAQDLRIDLVDASGQSVIRAIHEAASVPKADFWFPAADAAAGSRLHLSQIRRIQVSRSDATGAISNQWEPVIWAVARVDPSNGANGASPDAPIFLRILMTLQSTESARHLFALFAPDGTQLARVDEGVEPDQGNDLVFTALNQSQELKDALKKRQEAESNLIQKPEPKVDRLVRSDFVPLKVPYYFQEGLPSREMARILSTIAPDSLEESMLAIQSELGGDAVRVGGLLSGVREVRLLARSRKSLEEVRSKLAAVLGKRLGHDTFAIHWRNMVRCDEMHSWILRFYVGEGRNRSDYLLHYAVLDDELASSIQSEMTLVRLISLLVAGGFGLVGFLLAMRFIRPLKQMTHAAQKITDSPRERLVEEVTLLTKRLDFKRRDEIGDIARASKRLFEEIIAFQSDLEKRVTERTTELRRTNLELEVANEKLKTLSYEKDSFVAKVSHDLRQPLNAIFLQVEALKLSSLDDQQRHDLDRISDHAARELTLVNDILEYQKIIMGAEVLRLDSIDITALMTDLALTYRTSLGDRPISLIENCPESIGSLTADERRLRQILGNLLGNACKFTREGSITLAGRSLLVANEEWIEFTVTDTGRGMTPEEQSKVFTPFVSNKKDNAGGTGLGLSICRELTTQMGGRIGFVSELDRGTHFCVRLPRSPNAPGYDPERTSADRPSAQRESRVGGQLGSSASVDIADRGKPTLLVVDDDQATRELLCRLLENSGHRILVAGDGATGLRLAREQRPDAIILDVVMPGDMDGWEVLRRLKESSDTHSIPVIMVSLMAEQEHALALEIEDYLEKPLDMHRLSRAVARATEHAPQHNLLLVDDDVNALSNMARLLEAEGWLTLAAPNGAVALAALAKTRPAAIILDLMMPEMDGFEFLRRLRENPSLSSIPVIVMSGADPTDDERSFLSERVDAVLRKGSHGYTDLLATISSVLHRKNS